MLRIAVCDDDKTELERIANELENYKSANNINMECRQYNNGAELLNDITEGCFYDLIFLDIVMPDVMGIDIAKELYKHNKTVKVVFLTISPEFAADSYNIFALDYIIKPITAKRLAMAMQKFKESRRRLEYETIIIQEKSRVTQIPLCDLCFVEVLDHRLIYHLLDSGTVSCRQSLSEIESLLKRNGRFFKTHRSFIVNIDYIKRIDTDGVTMINDERVLISRVNYKALTDSFLKYKFEGGG